MKWLPIMLFGVVILSGIHAAGCFSTYSSAPPVTPSSSSPVRMVVAGIDEEWSFSLGCYVVITGYAYNTGSEPIEHVVAYLSLNYQDGTIRDSTSVYLGNIEPRGFQSYRVVLNRECGKEYSIQVVGIP
jgi:hypothetical protein